MLVHSKFLLIIFMLSLLCPVQQAYAASPENPYTLPAITVTANKRPSEVQKTPVAITVVDEQKIEDAGIRTPKDVLRLVPNTFTQGSLGSTSTLMSFRGSISSSFNATSPLVMYMDGVPIDTYYNMDMPLLDIERVEIIRSGQGTLYGKNALGGVINILSKKPTNELVAKISGYGESSESYGMSAMVSGPIVEDKLYFSLSGQHEYSRGWVENEDNEFNRARTSSVKGLLRWTPNDQAEINLHANYTARRDGFTPVTPLEAKLKNTASNDDLTNDDVLNLALQGTFDFDNAILESVSTYRMQRIERETDFASLWSNPASPSDHQLLDRDEVSQEFRLRSPNRDGKGFEWLVGLYGSYASIDSPKWDGFLAPFGKVQDTTSEQEFYDFAPFAQISIPFADAFKFTAGLRYQYTQGSYDMRTIALPMFGYDASMAFDATETWSALLPHLSLSYDITDNHMVYASATKNFMPGGFNWSYFRKPLVGTISNSDIVFDEQTSWTYETGIKTQWFNNRLMTNLTFFYNDFENMQVAIVNPGTFAYNIYNVPKAHSYGAELELSAILTEGLTFEFVAGLVEAKYDKYKVGNINYSGNNIQWTPDFTANTALTYRHMDGFFARAQLNYIGKLYWNDANTESRDPLATVDARIGYEAESFDVYLYGRNIFDARYFTTYSIGVGTVAEPQTFGLELTYKF